MTETGARRLALGAIAGPVLLTAGWVVLGLMRAEVKTEWGVSGGVTGMITQPFSGLGLGVNGFLFNAAFFVSGLLLFAGVYGAFQTIEDAPHPRWRKTSLALLALPALGLLVDGVFTLESFKIHMLGFLLGCGIPMVGFVISGLFLRRIPQWRRFGTWLILGSPLTLVLTVIFFANFDMASMAAARGVAGLTERILVLEVFAWYAALGWIAFRSKPDALR
jgi:amino acid permease